MSARSDCRKFAPNIFNKSKCTNCFRQKEEHSAEALESNRASRKVSKCGYLFVAPGWDFSNPLNRTKRWQRRWFVLYDDGELTYSLDEHPDTVPQACVDMTLVLEVREADEVTGHPFSLAIASPDRVTFVKGACREEARWWSDVLSVYPRNKGRHKRNATFPGGQAGSLLQNGTTIRNGAGSLSRPRHNSCHAGGWAAPPRPPAPDPPAQVALPPPATPPLPTPEPKVYTDQPVSSASPPTRDKINSEDKARSRRGAARGRRTPAWGAPVDQQEEVSESAHHRILLEEYESDSKREEKLKDIALSLTRPRERGAPSPPAPDPPTREAAVTEPPASDTPDVGGMPDKYVRGDPDGCVRGAAARVELPAEGLLNMRKGWLLRQVNAGSSPARHWFVLRGAALLYYRDPSAEDCGIMDGVIDLNGVAAITESSPARSYGFVIKTWDNRQYTLSALTAGIRANWISAIRRTAGLPDPSSNSPDKIYPEKHVLNLDRQETIDNSESSLIPSSPVTPIAPMAPRSIMFSSDEEYRTASEGGRRDSVDWGDSVTQLPPSPILNRNPISRVKEKVRSRNIQHNSSIPSSPQSDETPPSDIDETDNLQDRSFREILDPYAPIVIDKIRKEDIIKPLKTSYISTIDKQAIEIEDLRKQLKIAQHDVNTAEKELKRFRQVKSESVLREKKIDDLLATLQNTEDELNRRTKEAVNLEALKKMYSEDKCLWESKLTETEAFLKESTEHCILLNRQLEHGQQIIEQLQAELSQLNDRLIRGAKENEVLYIKIQDLERRNVSRGKSIESLSELANLDLDQELESMNKDSIIEEYDDLRGRFDKAIQEIRAMKRELRESHNLYDELELTNHSLQRDIQMREENNQSQISMMAARIQDLTQKLSSSDKQVRALKHKLQKSESRDKRRSLSLKGKDSFSIGKEVEEKLTELENKITLLEGGTVVSNSAPLIQPPSKPSSPTKEKSPPAEKERESKSLKRLSSRLRRKSLDSATSSEPMKMLIRLSSLETKVGNALDGKRDFTVSCESLSRIASDNISPDSSESHSSSPHRHLLDRLQSLENVVISSRNKVNECICQVSAIRSSRNRRSPSPILDKTYSMKTIQRCLTDVSKKLQDCTDKCVLPFESIYEGGDINDSIINIVHQLELQLRTKLLDINKKKCALLKSGELNQRRNLEFLAEKLAYEAVLISRISDAVTDVSGEGLFKRLIKSEVEETSQLVTSLQSKLNGSQIKRQTTCKTSMDYLAKILSRKINLMNNGAMDKCISQSQNIMQMKELEMLKALQKEITASVNQYKSEKLMELTKALLIEALNCQPESGMNFDQQRTNLENIRIQEAWNKAQDIVNNELINSEISHVMTRCAQYYATQLDAEKKSRFTLVASQQAALEKWFQVAHEQLSIEMKIAITDITSHYQECLTSVRLRSPINEDRPGVDSRQLLYQLADVIAHKVLIDAKIYVCSGGYDCNSPLDNINGQHMFSSGIHEESAIWDKMTEADNVVASLDSDPTQEAEFIYLFQHFSNECRALFSDEYADNKEDLVKIGDALRQVEMVVKHLHLQIGDDFDNKEENINRESENKPQVQGVLDLCESLKRSVEALSTHIPCEHCLRLQNAISRLRSEQEETLAMLKTEQDKGAENKRSLELVRGRARTAEELVSSLQQQHRAAQRRAQRSEAEAKQLKQQITDHQSECQHLKVQHEQEQAQLKERARRLERRLGTLDSEYSQQLEQLRSAYHKSINADLQGDSVRQRYQAEIEQLRVLCEKGLLAMESSHRRIIQELEDKHRAEREQLRVDKEQALAEETQATLAALDAMRKAHENEVQREVSKFKREFTSRTQQGVDMQLHTRHQEEMEEIKQEILSLSEKYSSKCVESAALEEKLCNVTQQLAQAQQHILQLDARNKQLRAHLMSEMNEMSNSEIVNGSLRDSSSPHGQGSAGLSTQSTPLWDHLRHLATVWQNALAAESNKTQSVDTGARKICGAQNQNTVCKDRKYKEPQTLASTELGGFPRVSRCSVSSRRASISPLVGIVAERKKRFEL